VHDYYQVLGVARNASPQIMKLAFEGKLKALADPAYAATPAEKREEERLLREALVTLTVPAKRAPYDAKLEAFEAEGPAAKRPAWLVPAALASVLALAAGGMWVNQSREKERLRLAEERLAMEKETARRSADAEDARIREAQARREEAVAVTRERSEQLRVQRERAEYERWRRTQEAQARYADSAQERQARNEIYAKQREEERLRREEEARRRQAQYEVERQKQYLRSLELEEERARAARHESAQREAREREYQRMMEEQRQRVKEGR
jgi:curved DNA-binding protein CbpA